MKKVDLNGYWKLICAEPQEENPANVRKPCFNKGDWLDVCVPGDVNNTLLQNGKIPDPHYDTQARECYWVTSKEWWYTREFSLPETASGNVDLCMLGVFGNTDIWLNDVYMGETKNSFRLHRFSVKKQIRKDSNVLLIRFRSIDRLMGGPRLDELAGWKERRAFLRMPQFSFGWDWALPLPPIGFGGNVWLEVDNDSRLMDVSVQTYISGRVDFSFEVINTAREKCYDISVVLSGYGNDIKRTVSRNSFKSYISLQLENPQLWFPNGYGEQPLYNYCVKLIVDGQVIDTVCGKIGLRESKIVEEPFTEDASPGYSFRIELNGNCVFCKGGNWIPLHLWPGIIKPEDYEYYIRKAKEAGFNMLRVWGGGIYEHDRFYDLCDECGIMVWEDFMFAGACYPVDMLREEIISEADYQIRRLRNHSCIVLWCGCNEDIHSFWAHVPNSVSLGQQDTGVYSEVEDEWRADDRLKDDLQIYTMILRGLVSRFGLGVPYVESSPQSRDDMGNMPNSGNSHISCWKYSLFESGGKYEDFRKHFERVCSFNSEFCIQGPASVKMIKSFLKPENYWPPDDAWIYHIQKGHANLPHHVQTMWIAGALFGEIDSLEKYVKYGQAAHVEMMRAEFESARRDYPNNGGTMMWMYNDCWPTSNWSIIDYSKSPKPSYYAAKRACVPLLPVIFERSGRIEFLFSNQTRKDIEAEFVYGQETLYGRTVWTEKHEQKIRANESCIFHCMQRSELHIPNGDFLFIDAIADGKKTERVIYFADGWRDIDWPEPGIAIDIEDREYMDGEWRTLINIKTIHFARLCHVLYTGAESDVFFSDNYFDLASGESRRIYAYSGLKTEPGGFKAGNWLTDFK